MSTLDSAIRILQCLSAETPLLRVSEIAGRLDLPKSTVSRLLKTLSDGGLLERNEQGRHYSAGPLTVQLGGLYQIQHGLLDLVDDAVGGLARKYGFTGYVGVLDGADVVVLRYWQGSYPLRYVLEVGTRMPAFETSMGVALLALNDDAAIAAMIGPEPRDEATGVATTLAAVLDAVATFRDRRSVEVACASVPGITAIGSAVAGRGGPAPAIGFSLSFPDIAADTPLRRRMAADVARAAEDIAALLGRPMQPSRSIAARTAGGRR